MKQLALIIALGLNCAFFSCNTTPSGTQNQPEEALNNPTGNPTIDALSKKILESPNDPALYLQRGKALMGIEEFNNAKLNFLKAFMLDSNKIDHIVELADAQIHNVEPKEAVKTLQNGLKRFPNEERLRLNLAEMYHILEQHDKAMAELKVLFKSNDTNPQALLLQGMVLLELGDTLLAGSAFQSCTEQDPNNFDAYIYLGNLSDHRNSTLALKYFDNAQQIDTNSIEPLLGKAVFFHKRGEYANALDLYKKASAKKHNDHRVQYNTGLTYWAMKDYQKAYDFFDLTIKLEPDFIEAFYYRGQVNEKLNKKDQAITDYKTVIQLMPEHKAAKEALKKLGQ